MRDTGHVVRAKDRRFAVRLLRLEQFRVADFAYQAGHARWVCIRLVCHGIATDNATTEAAGYCSLRAVDFNTAYESLGGVHLGSAVLVPLHHPMREIRRQYAVGAVGCLLVAKLSQIN